MIPGVTDKKRLPRLGKIRLGEKARSQSGAEYPRALDHFNLTDAPAVKEVYGDKPTDFFPLLLPSNDNASFWRTSRSAYGRGTGLFCRCEDGVTAMRVNKGIVKDGARKGQPADPQGFEFIQAEGLDVDEGDLFELPCPADECPYWEKKMCKNLASFDFYLPKVAGFGTWCIQTSSFNSIRNIESTLVALRDALGGQIAGIPLGLRLVPQQAQVDGKAKTIRVMELICPFNLQQLAGLRRKAISAGGAAVALLEAGEPVPDDLMPHAGGALDAQLGGDPVPPASKLAPEPGTSRFDQLVDAVRKPKPAEPQKAG